jgi:hypothetical protein
MKYKAFFNDVTQNVTSTEKRFLKNAEKKIKDFFDFFYVQYNTGYIIIVHSLNSVKVWSILS